MAGTGENIFYFNDGRWKEKELFSALAREWFDKQSVLLKETSINKYRNILKLYLIPEFGEKYIPEITRDELSAYVLSLRTDRRQGGKGLSPKYITDILTVFKGIIKFASEEKQIKTSSFRGIYVRKKRTPLRVLSIREQKVLEDYLMEQLVYGKNLSGAGILLCLYSGIRLGELCALKWKDISFRDRTLHIHSTMTRVQFPTDEKNKTKIICSLPKSDCSIREIPIPKKIFEMLAEMKASPEAYFLTGSQERSVEPRTMENRFKATLRACGIEDANFHTLRHTFATRCVELGFDVKTLSEILGHASVKITMDRYVHPTMEIKQKNMEKLSEIFTGCLSQSG